MAGKIDEILMGVFDDGYNAAIADGDKAKEPGETGIDITAKQALLKAVLDSLAEEETGWTNFGKSGLTDKQEGHNQALSEARQAIKGLFNE